MNTEHNINTWNRSLVGKRLHMIMFSHCGQNLCHTPSHMAWYEPLSLLGVNPFCRPMFDRTTSDGVSMLSVSRSTTGCVRRCCVSRCRPAASASSSSCSSTATRSAANSSRSAARVVSTASTHPTDAVAVSGTRASSTPADSRRSVTRSAHNHCWRLP